MFRSAVWIVFGLLLTSFAAGCGEGGIALAPVSGTVTMKGEPVSGANVTFIPESGPIAVGTTDAAGKFTLSTAGQVGAPLGKCRASIILAAPTDDLSNLPPEERTRELTKMMGQNRGKTGEKEKKLLVPEKYTKADTSGLSYTISSNASENDFKIDLVE